VPECQRVRFRLWLQIVAAGILTQLGVLLWVRAWGPPRRSSHNDSPVSIPSFQLRESLQEQRHKRAKRLLDTTNRIRRVHWVASRRIDRTSMGRRRFRGTGLTRSPIGRRDGGRGSQDGSFPEGRSLGRANCRSIVGVEADCSTSGSWRLGVCLSACEGQTAILARNTVAISRQARCETCKGNKARVLSQISAIQQLFAPSAQFQPLVMRRFAGLSHLLTQSSRYRLCGGLRVPVSSCS
jgi:hypothetical protein